LWVADWIFQEWMACKYDHGANDTAA